jgi:hypothetical protein
VRADARNSLRGADFPDCWRIPEVDGTLALCERGECFGEVGMERTQRLRTAGGAIDDQGWGGGSQQQSVIAVLAVAALMIALFAYVIMRAGPTLISALGPFVSSLPSERSMHGWIAPSVAAGALLAGGSLAAMGLAAFVKGVRVDPFRWLAPVLIAFSSVVMTRLGLERSMGPLPASLFGALTALLLLGGGVLVQAQGLAVAIAGAVLLALPVLGLVLDQAHYARGIENLLLARDPNMVLALLVLCMTSVGVGLTAFVGRPTGTIARASSRSRDSDKLRGQLSMTIERMQASEQRASSMQAHIATLERALAEQQSYGTSFAAEEAAFAAAARPQGAQRWFILFGMIVVGASIGAVGLHVAMVRPLHAQVAVERAAATKALEARAAEVAALRVELSGERAKAGELQKIEQERAAAAAAELKAAQEKAAAIAVQETEVAEPESVAKKQAPAAAAKKRVARAAKRERAAAKRSASAPADNSGLRDAVSDDPIGGLE